jgi:predicted SAM-dependent methyltransferase
MLKRIIKRGLHAIGIDVVRWVPPPAPALPPDERSHPDVLTHQQLRKLIHDLSYWQDKIKVYEHFSCASAQGAWVDRRDGAAREAPAPALLAHAGKVHYGCGNTYLPGWLNIDLTPMAQIEQMRLEERRTLAAQLAQAARADAPGGTAPPAPAAPDATAAAAREEVLPEIDFPAYAYVNVLERHPFADNSVKFGFSEDMIEHLMQGDSILALSEMYRALAPGGILRLTFPSLEGVLLKHYTPPTAERVMQGDFEAYEFWDHIHFYSKDELRLVASHLGFRDIRFVEFHQSEHAELRGLETRDQQVGLNLYVEMTK